MCFADLVTTSLGRSALPWIFLRTRRCRRVRDAVRDEVRFRT
jgi:hypothetical protein